MYKGASESLQRRHAVDKPHPSRGYIDGASDVRDVLPPPDTLTGTQLRAERDQLRTEMARIEQELAVAKAARNERAVAAIGQRKMVHQSRLSAVNDVFRKRNQDIEHAVLNQAVREICDEDTCTAIYARCREIKEQMPPPEALAAATGTAETGETPAPGEASQSGPRRGATPKPHNHSGT